MAQFFRRKWPGVSYGRGEDWHYVGEAGEPAFQNSWGTDSGFMALAFRIREAGVVDIHGVVSGGTDFTIFTLPDGYRPSTDAAPMFAVDSASSTPAVVSVLADGSVRSSWNGVGKISFAHQVFLNLPTAAP